MIFLARMDVTFPAHLTEAQIADFQVREKEYSGQLQTSGKMAGIWRIVGEYANHSLFPDVPVHEDQGHAVGQAPELDPLGGSSAGPSHG
jgi:muconolactone delta-isomerase